MEFFDLLDKCNKNCNKGRSKQFFLGNILNKGDGGVKFWWPIFLAMKFTNLFPKFGEIHIFISKSA